MTPSGRQQDDDDDDDDGNDDDGNGDDGDDGNGDRGKNLNVLVYCDVTSVTYKTLSEQSTFKSWWLLKVEKYLQNVQMYKHFSGGGQIHKICKYVCMCLKNVQMYKYTNM